MKPIESLTFNNASRYYNASKRIKSPSAALSPRPEAQRTEAYASPLRSLRPYWGEGASRHARVGRVRGLDCLSILLGVILLFQTCEPVKFWRAHIVFPQSDSHSRKGWRHFALVRGGTAQHVQRRIFSSCSSSVLQLMQRVVTGRAFSLG
jgi:hypothetical protein